MYQHDQRGRNVEAHMDFEPESAVSRWSLGLRRERRLEEERGHGGKLSGWTVGHAVADKCKVGWWATGEPQRLGQSGTRRLQAKWVAGTTHHENNVYENKIKLMTEMRIHSAN